MATSVPRNTPSQFKYFDPTSLKNTQSKPRAKKTKQNVCGNHGEAVIDSSKGLKDDSFTRDHRTGTHESAMGDSQYQLRRELCDEGVTNHATLDLTLNESFHRGGRDLHPITENKVTGTHQNSTGFQLNNDPLNSQDKIQYLTTANGRDNAKQCGNLHTAVGCAFSTQDIEGTYHEGLTVEETYSGISSEVYGSSKGQKRSHQSSFDDGTITTLEAEPNVVPDSELDSPHPPKRQRMAERQAPSSIIEFTRTPESTPLLHPDDQAFYLGTNDSFFPSPFGTVHEEDCTISAALQAQGTMTLSEGLELEEDIGQESSRGGVNRQGSGSKNGQISGEKPSRNDSRSIPSSISKRHRRRALTPETGRMPSNTALGKLDYNAVPTRPPQQVKLSQPRQDSMLERLDIHTGSQPCFPGSNSLSTTAKDGTNIDFDSGSGMSCQITDLTLCTIPNDSSVVFATLRHDNSNRSLDLVALSHNVLGEQGKVIRMTQLSPDSWVLLGYQCNGSAADLCNRGELKANWMSSAHDDVASHRTDRSNDGYDEEDENGEQDTRGHSQRTHKRWLESEEVLLLSLKDKQCMEWEEVCKRFPSRTLGAVKLRYHTLKKCS